MRNHTTNIVCLRRRLSGKPLLGRQMSGVKRFLLPLKHAYRNTALYLPILSKKKEEKNLMGNALSSAWRRQMFDPSAIIIIYALSREGSIGLLYRGLKISGSSWFRFLSLSLSLLSRVIFLPRSGTHIWCHLSNTRERRREIYRRECVSHRYSLIVS